MMHSEIQAKPIYQTLLIFVLSALLLIVSTHTFAKPAWKDSTSSEQPSNDSSNSNKGGKNKPSSPTIELLISQVPADQSVTEGENVSFSISATMSDNSSISYQWLYNGDQLTGATDDILNISYATLNDEGIYSVYVSTSLGTERFDATLSVAADQPISDMSITQQPTALNATEGDQHTLYVAVNASRSVNYQWRKNGESLSGETSPSLIFSNMNLEDAGQYDVVISDGLATLVSQPAEVQVSALLATSIALSWDTPTEREDGSYLSPEEISGYQIYLELSEAMIQESLWVSGELQSVELNEMPAGTYRFAIATIDSDGVQGKTSEWISLQIN